MTISKAKDVLRKSGYAIRESESDITVNFDINEREDILDSSSVGWLLNNGLGIRRKMDDVVDILKVTGPKVKILTWTKKFYDKDATIEDIQYALDTDRPWSY